MVPPRPMYDDEGEPLSPRSAREIYWMVMPESEWRQAQAQWAAMVESQARAAGDGDLAGGLDPSIRDCSRSPSRGRLAAPSHAMEPSLAADLSFPQVSQNHEAVLAVPLSKKYDWMLPFPNEEDMKEATFELWTMIMKMRGTHTH